MTTINSHFIVSPRMLDHLGVAAYNSIRKCLAELTANAYDADAENVWISIPNSNAGSGQIVVRDDGLGMSPEDIKNSYLVIGRNRRKEGQKSATKKRPVVGSKGIGKFAGFGVARHIMLESTKDGVTSTVHLRRELFDTYDGITNADIEIDTAPSDASNGTKVTLTELSEELSLSSQEVISRHLFRVLPNQPDFTIHVNDEECTADVVHGDRHDFAREISGAGEVHGFYVVGNARQPQPGLAIRVRGRLVTEPSLFGLSSKTHGFFTAERIVGEINAEFLDPVDAPPEQLTLINTTRDGFLEDAPSVEKLEDWAQAFLREVLLGIDETEKNKRAKRVLEDEEISQRLDQLPAHVRARARKVVRAVIGKQKNADDEEAKILVEWVLRFYESNALSELFAAITKSDVTDAERLASLIQDWGVEQLGSVGELVREQIAVIEKLESLVNSDAALEIDLHKVIEKNLWLVREGLDLWSSDKPLKSVLDGHIDELYKLRRTRGQT